MGITAVNVDTEPVVRLATTTRVVLIVEYDGTRYHGSQWQAGLPTIQGEIEKALGKLTGERKRVTMASRTDAGVHARGQVVSFKTASSHSRQTFINGLNYYLPGDIVVKAAHRVSESFNVRRQAVSREYHYCLLNSRTRSPLRRDFAHLVPGNLDIEAMNKACEGLIGEHDFASFASDIKAGEKSTVRQVYRAEVCRDGELVVFQMVANSFLPHQIRNTVGALIRVGWGKMTLEEFNSIVQARQTGLAGPTAPAFGLCLVKINYPVPLGETNENL